MSFNFTLFIKHKNLRYGFSEKSDGSLHRHYQQENRKRYFKTRGIDFNRLITTDGVHGSKAVKVLDIDAGKMMAGADGLVTNIRNLPISTTGGDCFLIYFYDLINNAIGIAHAGWRGILAGVIPNTLEAMFSSFGTSAKDLLVGISPGIRKCHFEISPSDKVKFESFPKAILTRENKVFVDLPLIILSQLEKSGILKKNIEDSNVCTYCNKEQYFSYRRDKPKETEVMAGYIYLT